MFGRLLLLTLLLQIPTWSASAEENTFQQAFRTYVEVKSLEQELALLPFRTNKEEEEKEQERKKISAALTQRRIEFQNNLTPSNPSTFEKLLFISLRVGNTRPLPTKESLDYLAQHFPAGKKMSAMEWQVIRDWFGNTVQESFLKVHFEMAKMNASAKGPESTQLKLVYLVDPYKKLRDKKTQKNFKQDSIRPNQIVVSAFNKIDEQADETYRLLRDNYSEEPIAIVTSGESSAIFFRALDLHPELRHFKSIKAWVNADGRLYGIMPEKSYLNAVSENRSPASMKKINPSDAIEIETLGELFRLHSETRLRPLPVGKGFPIFNIVSFDEKFRATQNLSESMVQEGSSYYVEKGPAINAVGEILSQLENEPKPGRELRDPPGAKDFSI